MVDKYFNERDKNRISIIYAWLVFIGFMNYIIASLFDIGGMITSLVIMGIMMAFCYKTMIKVRFPARALVFALIVVLYYIITRRVAHTTLFGREFLFYFCAVSVMAMYKCDTEKFLRYVSVLSMVILFFYRDIYIEMNSSTNQTDISMGLSYAMLPILMAPMFHFFFFRKQRKQFFMYIIYAIAAFLLVGLCLKGNRGIILSVVVTMGLIYIKGLGKRSKFHIGRAVFILMLACLFIAYFYDIVRFFEGVFKDLGIEAFFLEKILDLERAGDVSNGRINLFEYSWKEFLKKPILGHGIATVYYNSRGRYIYAHNFILQLLYDGGVILTIPSIAIIIGAFRYAFSGKNREESVFTLFMICVTLPRAFFTGDVWENTLFWLFIMHSLAHHVSKSKTALVKEGIQTQIEGDKPDKGESI